MLCGVMVVVAFVRCSSCAYATGNVGVGGGGW